MHNVHAFIGNARHNFILLIHKQHQNFFIFENFILKDFISFYFNKFIHLLFFHFLVEPKIFILNIFSLFYTL